MPRLMLAVFVCGLALLIVSEGCQAPRGGSRRVGRHLTQSDQIRSVVCVYDDKRWLNLDRAGDRDPEGIRFRVFLDPGTGRGVLADGILHIEMYLIERLEDGKIKRSLASDWHYPTSEVHVIAKPGMLGEGYFPHLRWSLKDIAGKEVEFITEFEDHAGRRTRSSTKRLRVPKYAD